MKKYVIPGLLGFGALFGTVGLIVGLILFAVWIDDQLPTWLAAWIIMGFPVGIIGMIAGICAKSDSDKKKAEEESK